MIGAVGSDQYGSDVLKHLAKEHINIDRVVVSNGEKTGIAVIIVEEQTGENRILYSAGANYSFLPNAIWDDWWGVGLVVLQLEIPLDAVRAQIFRVLFLVISPLGGRSCISYEKQKNERERSFSTRHQP